MNEAGYRETELDMEAMEIGNRLRFWGVDEGVLIATYSAKNKEVLNFSYWLTDERPKAFRKTFKFEVISFDTKSGLIRIQTKKTLE